VKQTHTNYPREWKKFSKIKLILSLAGVYSDADSLKPIVNMNTSS